jgi:hypothetical protein
MSSNPKAGIPGLPVKGYQAQPQEAVEAVNLNKVMEEQVLRRVEEIARGEIDDVTIDGRWVSIARTHFQQGFMALNRAIFNPGRISLPGDIGNRDDG